MSGLRVAFAGTPAFAATALQAIGDAGFTVPLVLTQPDRPAGRGMKLLPSPVKQLALERGWPLAQPRSLRRDGKYPDDAAAAGQALQQARPDVMVVAAYGLILPEWVLTLPPYGCLNIHGSLLPRWRGAAPIQRAIEAGDTHTGISIMRMDAGLDTGPECLREALPITPDDDAATLHDRLAPLGARLIVQALRTLARDGRLDATPQPADGVTYAHKLDKAQARVDWREPAAVLERRARAFDPAPGLAVELDDGQAIKLWRGRVVDGQGAPGQVLDAGPGRAVVACGDGALEWLSVQRPGGRRQPAAEFLRAQPLAAGTRLPLPD